MAGGIREFFRRGSKKDKKKDQNPSRDAVIADQGQQEKQKSDEQIEQENAHRRWVLLRSMENLNRHVCPK